MIGIDVNADTLGGFTALLAVAAIALGVMLLTGLYAVMLWVVLVALGAATLYFGGRRLYRYFDEQFLSPDRPASTGEGWE